MTEVRYCGNSCEEGGQGSGQVGLIAACLALSGLGAAVVRGGGEGAVVRAWSRLDPGGKRLLILFAIGASSFPSLVSAAPARREEERSPRCHLSSRGGLLARWHDGKKERIEARTHHVLPRPRPRPRSRPRSWRTWRSSAGTIPLGWRSRPRQAPGIRTP